MDADLQSQAQFVMARILYVCGSVYVKVSSLTQLVKYAVALTLERKDKTDTLRFDKGKPSSLKLFEKALELLSLSPEGGEISLPSRV